MNINTLLQETIKKALQELYNKEISDISQIELQPTRKEFEGSHTFVTFGLAKELQRKPAEIAQELGQYLQNNPEKTGNIVLKINAVQGFLNITLKDSVWIMLFAEILKNNAQNNAQNNTQNGNYGQFPSKNAKMVVEYCSPNTNKPIHLGHLRNNFLGFSVSRILEMYGYEVHKTQIINDRGIHICKSMLAYTKFGNINADGISSYLFETPETTGIKGDHLVGKYYVRFDKELKKETKPFLEKIYQNDLEDCTDAEKIVVTKSLEKYQIITKNLDIEKQNIVSDNMLDSLNDEVKALFESWNVVENSAEKEISTKDLLKHLEDLEEKKLCPKDFVKQIKKISKLEKELDEINGNLKLIAQNKTAIMKEAQEMLRLWEQNDPKTVELWQKMNTWVYAGFDATYQNIGVSFDSKYYESDTYILGKDMVEEGLKKGVFYQKEDNSVWADLSAEGLDHKIVLRSDGTSVYITQDLGTADLRHKDHQMQGMVYVVGNEQDHHFKQLFAILKKLGKDYAKNLYHLSYGMVDLPSGKMKSREGTVVDADDMVQQVINIAETRTKELGKIEHLEETEAQNLYKIIGLGALKYFLLKVDPKKRMLYNPEESVDFQGDTAPAIQYAYVRTASIKRSADLQMQAQEQAQAGEKIFDINSFKEYQELQPEELNLIKKIIDFPSIIEQAAKEYAPSVIAQYAYEMTKLFSSFWTNVSILKAENEAAKAFRIALSGVVAEVIKKSMFLLGIDVPEKM